MFDLTFKEFKRITISILNICGVTDPLTCSHSQIEHEDKHIIARTCFCAKILRGTTLLLYAADIHALRNCVAGLRETRQRNKHIRNSGGSESCRLSGESRSFAETRRSGLNPVITAKYARFENHCKASYAAITTKGVDSPKNKILDNFRISESVTRPSRGSQQIFVHVNQMKSSWISDRICRLLHHDEFSRRLN